MPIICHGFPQSRGQGSFGCGQFEGEDEAHDIFEMGAVAVDLVYDIFQAYYITSDVLFDLGIRFYMDSLFTYFSM